MFEISNFFHTLNKRLQTLRFLNVKVSIFDSYYSNLQISKAKKSHTTNYRTHSSKFFFNQLSHNKLPQILDDTFFRHISEKSGIRWLKSA